MIDKKYSLPTSIVVDKDREVWKYNGTEVVSVPANEVWYSNQYRQSEWDGMWYVYKTHFYKHKANAFRWYRQRAIMSDYYAEFSAISND
tara:strand:+ start:1134 stop:1400 length:267 start_codon:yes stop_codon:yes gene_type:complete